MSHKDLYIAAVMKEGKVKIFEKYF